MKFYVNQETYDKLLTTINKLKEAIRNAEHNPITGQIYHIEQSEELIGMCGDNEIWDGVEEFIYEYDVNHKAGKLIIKKISYVE